MKQPRNPFLPSNEYLPDPEVYIFGERVYVYGSHDEFDGSDYCMNDYVCYSAPLDDLGNWNYEGVIYKKKQHPNSETLGNLFAPDVAKGPDGRFYLYYVLQKSNTISVAISDTPAGKFEYYGELKYKDGHIAGSTFEEYAEFDVAVLNDNGKYYLYSGTGQKENQYLGYPVVGLFVRELNTDMVTLETKPKILMPFDDDRDKPNFFEGASVSKFNGKYYLLYFGSDFVGLHYCISDYPDRDFAYGGLVHSVTDIDYNGRPKDRPLGYINNNHGSIQEINNQLYVFNHRTANRKPFSRQAVAEPIQIESDGSIKQVETTSTGLNNGPFNQKEKFPAYIACNYLSPINNGERNQEDAPYPTQELIDGEYSEQYVKDLKDGSIIGYKYFKFDETSQKITISIRGKFKGKLKMSSNIEEFNCDLMSEVPVNINTDEWIQIEGDIQLPNNKFAVYFKTEGTGYLDISWFEFE